MKEFGGDSSQVWGRLKGVQQVQATLQAFAAILVDGVSGDLGATLVATALASKISSRASNRFRQLEAHLLQCG